jgi:hypothetical protein
MREGSSVRLQRLLSATAEGSTIDREEHVRKILRELERTGSLHRRLDERVLGPARFHVPQQEAKS